MMAMSLDGFIARKDHTIDWLTKQDTLGEDFGFEAFQASIDVIVMGSSSFKTVLGFGDWPYKKLVIVLSKSMTNNDLPNDLKGKVDISDLPPQELMESLEARGCKRAYIDGGAVVQSFLRAGLVNDMRITFVPILIGDGIRLFGDLNTDVDLKLETVETYKSGLVSASYNMV
jgi:dihydrofolate reductase